MSQVVTVDYPMLDNLASLTANRIYAELPVKNTYKVYPVPRGGVAAALAVSKHLPCTLVHSPAEADAMVDDIVDSGATRERLCGSFPGIPFYALIDKTTKEASDQWYQFPWEVRLTGADTGLEDHITRLLQYVGEDPKRGGLLETPARAAKAWKEWTSGYGKDPADVLKVFSDGAEQYDEMVVVKDIPVYSHCEHHLAPIFGTATVAYIPNNAIVGLSKLSRLVDMYARRLQVQERLTQQVCTALETYLEPIGVGVCIKARHMCMESRGVCQQGHHTITTALGGVIKTEPSARAEFLSLV